MTEENELRKLNLAIKFLSNHTHELGSTLNSIAVNQWEDVIDDGVKKELQDAIISAAKFVRDSFDTGSRRDD